MNDEPELVKTEWEVVTGTESKVYAHQETALAVYDLSDKRRTRKVYKRETYRRPVQMPDEDAAQEGSVRQLPKEVA